MLKIEGVISDERKIQQNPNAIHRKNRISRPEAQKSIRNQHCQHVREILGRGWRRSHRLCFARHALPELGRRLGRGTV